MADTCSPMEEADYAMAAGASRLLIIDERFEAAPEEASARRGGLRRAAFAAAALALAGVALAVTLRRGAAVSGEPDAAAVPAVAPPVKGLRVVSLASAFSKTCPASSTREACECDCAWAQKQGGCDVDDGGCCYTCCCGELPHSNYGFDCNAGFANWKQGWDHQKKEWCCAHTGKGCEENYQPVFEPFDCDAGYANWQAGWSPDKKEWCCRHKGRGCETPPPAPPAYDCDAGFANWQAGWAPDKKEWCCHHTGRGCETLPPAPPAYDCDAGFANWQAGWSPDKKEWCCHHTGRGCHEELYDCDAGYANWRRGWSPEKKHYCCHHEGLGCDDLQPATTQPYDCDAGFANWQHGWSEPKKAWCCDHTGRGCHVEHHNFQAYDCDAGFANWKAGWSEPKKAWCCSHWGRGCAFHPDHDHDLPVDWNDAFHGKPHGYHPLHPILPPHQFPAYDCDAGFANWRLGWSEPKKEYCCLHTGRGCAGRQPAPHPTMAPAPIAPRWPHTDHCYYRIGQDVMAEYGRGWEDARVTEEVGSNSYRLMLTDKGTEVTRDCHGIRTGLFGFPVPNTLWVLAILSSVAIVIALCAACNGCDRSAIYSPYPDPRRGPMDAY